MPPKKRNTQQRGEGDGEEPFQAVILADTYDDQFLPISNEMPRCLMPLCNIPLIEYTLEALAITDVQEVFIVCTTHIDKIKEYFEQSSWLQPHSPLSVQIVQSPEAMSVGDAMRELDARQLITNDFILTFGDLVSNIKLDKIMETHRARKKTDKHSIMTMVLKEAARIHTSRAKDDSSVFVLDPNNNQCLFYEPVQALPRKARIEVSPEVFENHAQFEFRNDLVDPFLDICSVEVPALFTENFDWQKLRSDFVHGILTSDILGKRIYTEIISEPYVARIQNEQLYSTVSNHVLNRWVFPIVPETNLHQNDNYQFLRGNIYNASDVILSRSCIIDENVQIGSGSVIGENSRIANSVIGRNCSIGDNIVLDGAYIWDNVTIFANSVVTRSILANNVTLMDNTTVRDGCIISTDVTLGPDEDVPKYSRLSLQPQPKTSIFADDSDEEEEAKDQPVLSNNNHPDVYFWTERGGDDDDVDIRNINLGSLAYDMADLKINDGELSDSASEVGEVSDDEDDHSDNDIAGSFGAGWDTQGASKLAEFKKEVAQTIERSLTEKHTVDETSLEITGLRMAHNGTYDQVREVMIPMLLDHVDVSKNAVGNMRAMLEKWSPVISKGLEDQVHVLRIFQRHCAETDALSKLFVGILQILYNEDIVEEESVLRWYASDASKNGSSAEVKLRERAAKFVDWLQEAEEESSDDDEDSD
ncbi:nucleotide-diphospho-sugar transferase [Zychaea mexicana]|uniref:nucleotide-diphospho-sugar transferase n=1 Tax=Zychaea mexicana TaxID=64656 RepID=UPI0022FE098A|nr:nucleotide-diphospho-sugar transferase [Zychaea mexicana]KAI9498624.1 nucleotide-diphospho-sugar transferase [Zychaea mexicana]